MADAFALADLRCACGSERIVLVKPGTAALLAPGGIVIRRGVPVEGTCLLCWPAKLNYQQALFPEE